LDLNGVAARIIKNYEPTAQRKRIRLTSEFAANLSPILVDNLDVERILANLLVNALNYTPESGTVHVSTVQGANSVLLIVQDSGIGISSYALPYIFERSYRSAEAQNTASGMGLGLAIVQGIVEKYGGRIEVESVVGEGSTFKIYLPI
jgi:signal transduction histidine kinase